MTLFVLDTDVLSHLQYGNPTIQHHVMSHADDELAVTVISIEEQLLGWNSLLHRSKDPKAIAHAYERLAEQVGFLSGWQILAYSEKAIDRYERLKASRLNVGSADLKIAATVLEHNGVLVTRNRRDFERVPDLQLVDWTVP